METTSIAKVTQSESITNQGLAPTLQQHTPAHPALSRLRAKLVETSGVQVISAYDRMHHRHSRS